MCNLMYGQAMNKILSMGLFTSPNCGKAHEVVFMEIETENAYDVIENQLPEMIDCKIRIYPQV